MTLHRFRAAALAVAAVLPSLAGPQPASAAPQSSDVGARVVGSYVATRVSGGSVVRLELSLERDGRARLQTGSSRYSQRPESVAGGTVVETGTWHLHGAQIVLHIEKSSNADDGQSDKDKPSFADQTFVLAGCELRLVGSAFAFDKKHCG